MQQKSFRPLDSATTISLKGSNILAIRSRFVWFWTSLLRGPLRVESTIYSLIWRPRSLCSLSNFAVIDPYWPIFRLTLYT